jgi:hypothetical protein
MTNPDKLARLGLKREDAPYLVAFENFARQRGWDDRQIERAVGWYVNNFKPGMSPEDVFQSWVDHADRTGLPTDRLEQATVWYDAVGEAGPEQFWPEAPHPADDTKRLEEIRQIAREEPDRYDFDKNLHDEEFDILARRSGEDTFYAGVKGRQAAAEPTRGVTVGELLGRSASTTGADRLAEIRELRRNDPDAYDGNAALHAEELGLIAAQQAAPAASEPGASVGGAPQGGENG